MTNQDMGETIPTSSKSKTPAREEDLSLNEGQTIPSTPSSAANDQSTPPTKGRRRSVTRYLTLGGIAALLLIAFLSSFAGYNAGISQRSQAEEIQRAQVVQEQFTLGVEEMNQGEFSRARQRFEYVIQLDPNYPGATDKLAEVLLLLNATATPTPVPTATPVPIVDTSGIEGLLSQAEQQLANQDWNGAIDTLLRLRKEDPGYRMINVDGLLFIALRNRGIDKISKEADLEGGMYDLALAERFGVLDAEAQGYLNWVKLYVTGASFWELDWEQAVFYFSQVAPQLPGLRDGSGMSARERYRLALIGFGDTLMRAGDPCQAAEQYRLSLELGPDPLAEQALADALQQCSGGQGEEEGGETEPPAEGELPPAEPSAEPPAEPTEDPVLPPP